MGAVGIATDVTRREDVKECVKRAQIALGLPVCILVNCAGVMHYTRMSQLLEDQWAQEVSVNCMGVLNGIGAVLQGMIERKRGHIINMCGLMSCQLRPLLLTLSTAQNFRCRQESVSRSCSVGSPPPPPSSATWLRPTVH